MAKKTAPRPRRVPAAGLVPAELPDPGPSVRDHRSSRVIAHFVVEFILRSAESVAASFDYDYEEALIFLTISNRNSEKAMNDAKLRELYGSYTSTIPDEHVLVISRLALARATGLPRETVRRKVAKLIQRGLVVELKGGLRSRPDLSRDRRYIAGLEPQAQNLRRLFAMLISTGALTFG
jgi:hypothetical protein